jgi:YVTN family beta-propeller protein
MIDRRGRHGRRGRLAGGVAMAVLMSAPAAALGPGDAPRGPVRIGAGAAGTAEVRWIDRAGRVIATSDHFTMPDDADGEAAWVTIAHPAAAAPVARGGAPGARPGAPLPLGPATLETTFVSNGFGDEGDTPNDVAFTPDGSRIVVAHRDSRNLTVFDAATRDVLRTIPLGGSPNALAITADSTRAVTANIFEGTASIVDLVGGTETSVINVGAQPGVVRMSPDGVTAVVGNTVDSSLTVIDTLTETAIDVITGVEFAASTSIAFEHGATVSTFTGFEFADADTLLHPERFNARVQLIDLTAGTVTPIATAANPVALDISPDGTTAVVTHGSSTQLVSEIDVATATVVDTIPVGTDLHSGTIVIHPSKAKCIVGVLNEVRVVNLINHNVSPDLFTASLSDLLLTADGQYALAVGFNGALVHFLTETVVRNVNGVVSVNRGAHSPTGPQAALVGNLFTEEMLVVNTDGAAGFLEERVPSGPPPEGDKARAAAVAPDGGRVVAVNILSDTVSIVDPDVPDVTAIVATGDRPSQAAITPDSSTAVVANLDSTFATLVDLDAGTASSVPISRRASGVVISPDGQYAYLAVVADGDGVWRIDLDTMTVAGPKIETGDMGGIFFLYAQTSGMTLSHDGATLVTCNTYTDDISIIDTASWTEVKRLPVGDFPVRAAFSPDDSSIYVTNKEDDTVSVVVNAGAASIVTGTLPVGDQPFEMAVTPDGGTLFVANFAARTISVITTTLDAAAGTIVLNEPIQDIALDAAGERLFAAGGSWSVSIGPGPVVTLAQSGELSVIDVDSLGIIEQIDTGLPPGMLALHDPALLAAIPSPHGDGVLLVTEPTCAGDADASGTVDFADLLLVLSTWGPCPGCPADLDGDDDVDFQDLLVVLAEWGPCP